MAVTSAEAETDSQREKCDWYAITHHGEYGLHNDVWGAKRGITPLADYMQCMSAPSGVDGIGGSFRWKFRPRSDSIKSYPHVTYGWDFSKPVDAKLLPVRVGDLSSLLVQYDYDIQSKAKYNVAFDIWLSDKERPVRDDLTTELMIWIEVHKLKQKRPRLDRLTVNGLRYDFFSGAVPVGQWTYNAFVAVDRPAARNAVIDIAPYMRALQRKGIINSNTYVNGISFGAELTDGEGWFDIKNFRVVDVVSTVK